LGNSQVQVVEVETPAGLARAHVSGAGGSGLLVLGHGAGGGVTAADLVAVSDALGAAGWLVARVEQPYRVQGRRAPPRAPVLDAAWTAVVEQLRAGPFAGLGVVTGGRSSGARVACRTAGATGAIGVVCLAFPVHPPGKPEKTRLPELDAVRVPVLVVQGERDPFGMPPDGPDRTVVRVAGDHGLKADLEAVAAAVAAYMARLPA
jgi:predicted alpha/beta-hydrolase family hydrolase